MDYDYFPNWGEVSADVNSVWYGQTHVSLVNQKSIFLPTEQWAMGLGLDVTREDAARALVRFMESNPSITYGESKYISVKDVGTYDRNIIADELLSVDTDLPEVTQNKLPSEWQGAGIGAKKIDLMNICILRKAMFASLLKMDSIMRACSLASARCVIWTSQKTPE